MRAGLNRSVQGSERVVPFINEIVNEIS